jgi:hypothetical protein
MCTIKSKFCRKITKEEIFQRKMGKFLGKTSNEKEVFQAKVGISSKQDEDGATEIIIIEYLKSEIIIEKVGNYYDY